MNNPTPAEAHVRPARRGLLSRLSFVWLVPVLALVVSLGIAWQSVSERGVLIDIVFESASGVMPDKTEVKYRDVTIGLVEEVTFSDDLTRVVVSARVDRTILPYLDEDAQFWVVRPEVSVRGITGLNTVLSGVYIEGSWDSEPGEEKRQFEGLAQAPLATPARPGTPIVLRARSGNSIAAGAPILFKGIPVGAIEAPKLTETGESVVIDGFIEAPYDRILTGNTRFWDISGVSLSLGPGGVSLNFSSLASLVEGGIAFDTMVSGGEPILAGQVFDLYPDEDAARESFLNDPLTERLEVLAIFDGSVGGLTAGSNVRFRGVRVGEVTDIAMVASGDGASRTVRLYAYLALRPDLLGLGPEATREQALELLSDYVAQGVRARLATGGILTGELVVELAELPDAAPAGIVDTDDLPPQLPTVEAELSNLNATAEGVLARINALPIEELLASAQELLVSATDFVNSDDTRGLLPEATAAISDVRTLVPDVRETLADLRGVAPDLSKALEDAGAAMEEARRILTDLREGGATESFNAALNSAQNAADAVEQAANELPALARRLDAVAARAEATLEAYGDNSRLINGALATMRDVSEAAEALRALARTLQRNPNSLILGR